MELSYKFDHPPVCQFGCKIYMFVS